MLDCNKLIAAKLKTVDIRQCYLLDILVILRWLLLVFKR